MGFWGDYLRGACSGVSAPGGREERTVSPAQERRSDPVTYHPPPPIGLLGVCCASRTKPSRIAAQAIFFLANSVRSPIIVVFMVFSTKKTIKIYKCNRPPGSTGAAPDFSTCFLPHVTILTAPGFPPKGRTAQTALRTAQNLSCTFNSCNEF
jgi:hypothetical protein